MHRDDDGFGDTLSKAGDEPMAPLALGRYKLGERDSRRSSATRPRARG